MAEAQRTPTSGVEESGALGPETKSSFSQNVVEDTFGGTAEDVIDEHFRAHREDLPSLEEMDKFAAKIQRTVLKSEPSSKAKASEKDESSEDSGAETAKEGPDTEDEENEDDLMSMMDDAKTPIQETFKPKRSATRPSVIIKDRKPSTTDDRTYQESFASQQESAEMRHQIEALDTRLMNMENLFESLLTERKGLPKHLDNYREEMNKQLTVMMDRIHTALEQNVPSTTLEQSKSDVKTMTGETEHVFDQLTTDAENEPATGSATSGSAPITKSRRRVRLIK